MADILILDESLTLSHELEQQLLTIAKFSVYGQSTNRTIFATPIPDIPLAWLREWDEEIKHNTFLTSLNDRYAFPQPNPTSRSSYRPDRPVVRSLRSVNRNR